MSVEILTRVPITFEGVNGEPTHAPMVLGTFNDQQLRLVLDTGSDVHLLNEDLADALGLAKVPGEEGTDHSGATMPSWDVGNVELAIGDLSTILRGVVAIPAPRPFHALGIGGIASPQHLHPSAWAVLDLNGDEFLLVRGTAEEVDELVRARGRDQDVLMLARDPDYPTVVISAAVDPYPPIPTLINTGGNRTEFAADAVSGLAPTTTERLGGGVSGADVTGALIGPQVLIVDGRQIAVQSLAVRPLMHDPQGMIGMDVLRGTVLACSADLATPVFWSVRRS